MHLGTKSIWNKSHRVPIITPTKTFIIDNSFIVIESYQENVAIFTIQIKDYNGDSVYQSETLNNLQKDYKINIDVFQEGEYELIYKDEYIESKGTFIIK